MTPTIQCKAVRIATVDDAPAMARVMVDTYLAAHQEQMPEEAWTRRKNEWTYEVSEQGWTRCLRAIAEDPSPQECVYVALDEAGEIVGLAMGGPPRADGLEATGEVHALYVRESHQGHGHGRRLVQAVAAHMGGLGKRALLIACLTANAPARRFYEGLGGILVGEREFDEEGTMLPEVVYGWTETGFDRLTQEGVR